MSSPKTPRYNNASKQLVVNTVLISLIDPVRGQPTRDNFAERLDEHNVPTSQLMPRFLDSFALICSTSSKGRETASAVCFERKRASTPILRVARNQGLSPQDRTKLEHVLQILVDVTEAKKTADFAEDELMSVIADLDKDRIVALAQTLAKAGIDLDNSSTLKHGSRSTRLDALPNASDFRQWIDRNPFNTRFTHATRVSDLVVAMRWSADARWVYPRHLQVFLLFNSVSPPSWLQTLHKLARYRAAIRLMVKLAVKQPNVFTGIRLESVDPRPTKNFNLRQEEAPLRSTVTRLLKKDVGEVMDKLACLWIVNDPETTLRRACTLTLTLHAEMQLLEFYHQNADLVPALRHMGTSKKACYLCHEFMRKQSLGFRTSACHQKVYPTWMPPPCHESPRGPRITGWYAFSKSIEAEAAKVLKTELNGIRRPKNLDSTAGPTLTAAATVYSRM